MSELIRIGALAKAIGLHENTIRSMVAKGLIPSVFSEGRQRYFDLESVQAALATARAEKLAKRQVATFRWQKSFPISGLAEHEVWSEIKAAMGDRANDGAVHIMSYSFLEMLNNAIDHSQGSKVEIDFKINSSTWSFSISDDGLGAFSNIQKRFGLASPQESIGELTKGKRTTAPSGHSGEGIFFTSKGVDLFKLESNGIKWIVNNVIEDFAVEFLPAKQGTTVHCEIAASTTRRFIEIFEKYSDDFKFVSTDPVVKLFETGMDFLSRSEARRLMDGLEKFQNIILDFEKVETVGQGFVDEVFRVWAQAHPDKKISYISAVDGVEFMIKRGR